MSDFVANGGNIQLLCCKPYSNELFDIQNIEEKIYGDRQQIHREFTDVYSELINIYNVAKAKGTAHKNIGKIEVGFLSTLLRSSFLIFENTSNNKKTGWFTITLPPAKSRETVSFEIISNDKSVSSNNLILRTINHFNSIWNYAISKDEVFLIGSQNDALKDISDQNPKKYWEEKEKIAVFNTKKRKRNRKVLIEVAAQHPLTDGLYPNEEFAARLGKEVEESKPTNDVVDIVMSKGTSTSTSTTGRMSILLQATTRWFLIFRELHGKTCCHTRKK